MATDKILVLITGANTGLGYYAVQQLSATNRYHILLGSRSLAKAKDAISSLKEDKAGNANVANIEPIQIDVTSDESIGAAAKYIEEKYGYLDVLSNNAGISRAAGVLSDNAPNPDGSNPSLREEYQQLYNTNVFGPSVVIDTFLPLLRKSTNPGGKRIAFTGSSTGSLYRTINATHEGMKAKNYPIYRSTKTALNMVMASWTDRLEGEGFVVSVCCPGHCATNLNNHQGMKDPREGAKMVVKGIEGKKEDVHGVLFNEEGAIEW